MLIALQSKTRSFLFVFITLGIIGCGQNQTQNIPQQQSQPQSEVTAPRMIGDSFHIIPHLKEGMNNLLSDITSPTPGTTGPAITGPSASAPPAPAQSSPAAGDLKVNKAEISLNRKALEKEFLLQVEEIEQPNAALGHSLKSRVVAFRQRNHKLYMLEATQGHTVTHELPQTLVLAEFPVLRETDQEIIFDFNAGMSKLFIYSDWHSQAEEGKYYDPIAQFVSIHASISYIDDAKINSHNQLVIDQVAQLDLPTSMGMAINMPMKIQYYLSPYQPDPSFEPVVSKGFERMGFFEIAPQLTLQGTSMVRASKFNLKKPIVFAISANTPAEYRQAVREGVLYWNKAFGFNLMQVVDAPAGAYAPDLNYNVIQWVNWDQGGFAYADAQMDPRSGEILHAQVFIPSAFAFGGLKRAISLSRTLKTDENHTPTKLPRGFDVALNGFDQPMMCHYDFREAITPALAGLLALGATDAQILKLSQDYIRSVIAHEIGHTLGLRHNFAGSNASNYALDERDSIVEEYLKKGSAPSKLVTSSSVMDYLLFQEEALTGDLMTQRSETFEYDQKVIGALYLGKTYTKNELPLFCTDSHVDLYTDCKPFDLGSSSVEYAKWAVGEGLKKLPAQLLEAYIFAKNPDLGLDKVAVENVILPSPRGMAKAILAPRAAIFKNFTTLGKFLNIERQFPYVSEVNLEEVKGAEWDYLAAETKKWGGIDAVFSMIPPDYVNQATARFTELLTQDAYIHGIGYDGKRFEFTPNEMDMMKASVENYFKKFKMEFIKEDLKILNGENMKSTSAKITNHPVAEILAGLLSDRIKQYTFATEEGSMGATISGASEPKKKKRRRTNKDLNLPVFSYPLEQRMAAAELLKSDRGKAIGWGFYERHELARQFKDTLKKALTSPIDEAKAEDMPREVGVWILENKKVLEVLEKD